MVHEVPTGSAVAPQGLSLEGGGGAMAQVISNLPQLAVLSAGEQVGGGAEMRIK
jgi:hypothetical protein